MYLRNFTFKKQTSWKFELFFCLIKGVSLLRKISSVNELLNHGYDTFYIAPFSGRQLFPSGTDTGFN